MSNTVKKIRWASFLILSAALTMSGQTSVSFNLEHTVTASGGGRSSSPSFTLEGTAGQTSAGGVAVSPSFRFRDGFWAFETLVPTAANVSVSGRVRTTAGTPISGAWLTITDPVSNFHFQAYTNTFGYYRFGQIPAGGTYIITVLHNRYQFAVSSQTVNPVDDITGVNFYAEPQ